MKKYIWDLIEMSVTLIQSFIAMNFICSFFSLDLSKSKNKTKYVIGSTFLAILGILMNYLMLFEGIFGIIYSVYFLIFSLLFLDGSIIKKIFISISTNLCLLITAVISSSLMYNVTTSSIEDIYGAADLNRLITLVISILLQITAFGIFLKLKNENEFKLKNKEWILIGSVLFISMIVLILLRATQLGNLQAETKTIAIMLSELGIVAINVVCINMIVRLSKSNHLTNENALLKQHLDYQKKYADTIIQQTEELRLVKHDLLHHMSVMEGLLQEQKYDHLTRYINDYKNNSTIYISQINTNNEYLNAIINVKFSYAKSLGVNTYCSSIDDFKGISDVDLCNLFGNLIDNAIDACRKIDDKEKVIDLNIRNLNDRINILIKNTIPHEVLLSNPTLLTTKEYKSKHGYGIKTIKSIVKKYSGDLDYFEKNGMFYFQITI